MLISLSFDGMFLGKSFKLLLISVVSSKWGLEGLFVVVVVSLPIILNTGLLLISTIPKYYSPEICESLLLLKGVTV